MDQETMLTASPESIHLGSAPLESDRRGADRQFSVLLAAKVSANGREAMCRVHNISVSGAKIETLIPLQQGNAVCIEFRSDLRVQGEIRWAQPAMAGIMFNERVDIGPILKRGDSRIDRVKPRPPRYRCDATASVECDHLVMSCRIADLSVSGAKLSSIGKMRVGEMITLEIEGLPRHKAKVVWSRGSEAGVRVVNPYRYDEIEHWVVTNAGPTTELPQS